MKKGALCMNVSAVSGYLRKVQETLINSKTLAKLLLI